MAMTAIRESRLPMSAIATSPLGELLAFWTWSAQDGLPGWHRLGDFFLPSLASRTNVIGVQHDHPALRFVWRRHASDSVSVHGLDRSGKDTSTLTPTPYRELVERHYGECVISGKPTLYEIDSPFDHHLQPQFYRRLLLPFGLDRLRVDLLLTAWDTERVAPWTTK
jgi:hypothetical protein